MADIKIDFGSVRTGLWCDICLVPSVIEAKLVIIGDDGVQHVGTYRACTEEHADPSTAEDYAEG